MVTEIIYVFKHNGCGDKIIICRGSKTREYRYTYPNEKRLNKISTNIRKNCYILASKNTLDSTECIIDIF